MILGLHNSEQAIVANYYLNLTEVWIKENGKYLNAAQHLDAEYTVKSTQDDLF